MYSIVAAPPSRPRLVVSHLSSPFIALVFVSALLSVRTVSAAELPPLSFGEALQLASEQSPQLAAQRSAISAAEQATVSARQLPDPKLFFGIDNLPVTTADAFSLTQDFMTMRKIGVSQDFPRAEKRELKGKLAERVAAREQAILIDTRAAVRRDVASAWVERYFTERMGGVVDEQVAEVQLQSDAMRAGLKAGKTQAAEFLAVQLNLQTLLDKRAEFDKQAARAKAMLARWLGDAAARPLAAFTPPAVSTDHGALIEHLQSHPHVQSADPAGAPAESGLRRQAGTDRAGARAQGRCHPAASIRSAGSPVRLGRGDEPVEAIRRVAAAAIARTHACGTRGLSRRPCGFGVGIAGAT